jgi:hypothetical protein
MPAISETSEIIKNNSNHLTRTAGATVARSTPDRKVNSRFVLLCSRRSQSAKASVTGKQV